MNTSIPPLIPSSIIKSSVEFANELNLCSAQIKDVGTPTVDNNLANKEYTVGVLGAPGVDGSVLYNNSGEFGGNSDFIYDTGILTVENINNTLNLDSLNDINSSSLNIQLNAVNTGASSRGINLFGASSTTGPGGNMVLTSGDGGSTNGGNIEISSGNGGTNCRTGGGGYIYIELGGSNADTSGNGGSMTVTTGNSSIVGTGGDYSLTTGTGISRGGNITLAAGAGTTTGGAITLSAGSGITSGTITLGTAANRLALFGKTPGVIQQTTGVESATTVDGVGVVITEDTTFDGYTFAQVVTALRSIGVIA